MWLCRRAACGCDVVVPPRGVCTAYHVTVSNSNVRLWNLQHAPAIIICEYYVDIVELEQPSV